jgi:hypothetical protein
MEVAKAHADAQSSFKNLRISSRYAIRAARENSDAGRSFRRDLRRDPHEPSGARRKLPRNARRFAIMKACTGLSGADSMKILSSLILVGAVWGGYRMLSQHQAEHALRDVLMSSDVNGFVDVPPPVDQNLDTW